MRALLRPFLFMFLCGLAFDFRGAGEVGASLLQYLFLVVSVVGGMGVIICGLLLSRGRVAAGSQFGVRILWIALFFCIWAPVAVFVSSDTAHDDFMSVILPYLLYCEGILVGLLALQNGVPERTIIRTLLVVAAISCAWRLVYALTFGGIELSTARWQILSPLLPLILGASVAAFNTRTRRMLAALGMLYFLSIVTLSVTRGYLVSLAAVFLVSVLTARAQRGAFIASKMLRRIFVITLAVFTSVGLLAFLLPNDVSQRWFGRLSGEKSSTGQEITLLYRLAEFKGQYDELTRSPATVFAGRGFGARYIFDEDLLSVLEFISRDETKDSTNGSDSTWGYPIFAHGVILGTLFLGSVLMLALSAIKTCRTIKASGPEAFQVYFVGFSFAAFMGISLTANIFGERLGAVAIGSLAALALHQRRKAAGPSAALALSQTAGAGNGTPLGTRTHLP